MASAMPQSDSEGSPAWRGWRLVVEGHVVEVFVNSTAAWMAAFRHWEAPPQSWHLRGAWMASLRDGETPEEDGICVGAWDGGYAYSR
jgi:hypothetical protein